MGDSRGAVLIDGGYFEKLKLNFKIDIDLVKLSDASCAPFERLRTYYYDALPWIAERTPSAEDRERRAKKQAYFQSLTNLPRFEVRQGRLEKRELKCEQCGFTKTKFEQKLVDVLLSVDLVRLAWSGQINQVTLIAGDSDLVPAVKTAKEAGVIIKLLYAKEGNTWVHNELLNACDEKTQITIDFLKKFKL